MSIRPVVHLQDRIMNSNTSHISYAVAAPERPSPVFQSKATNTSLVHIEELQHTSTTTNSFGDEEKNVRPQLYHDGQLVRIPAPTRDPRDPMNLPLIRKVIALACLCFFGALIASAEIILGAALPIFALQYAGFNPKIIQQLTAVSGGFPEGTNSLVTLQNLGGPPIFQIFLLSTMPVLVIGVANLFLVPTAISIGRRPAVIIFGIVAICGAVWAGLSTSLPSHIAARCLQALGAASVESLIPLIIQDMTFVHERNTWISAAFGCQGIIIIAIGIAAPFMIVNLSWQWLYHITAIIAAVFLVGVITLLPETRWIRTRSEMDGVPRDDMHVVYHSRTLRSDLKLFTGTNIREGIDAFVATLRTFFYPSFLFVTLLNGSVISAVFTAAFTACPAFLTKPWSWPFQNIGLSLIATLLGALFVITVTGRAADYMANAVAKKRGSRVPENQLINLALPWACSIIGALLFGLSGNDQAKYPCIVMLIGITMMTFGFLGTSTITTVYVLESYPYMAGPALVNVASFRWIMAFFLTLWSSDWIVSLGYKSTFLIYVSLIAFFGLFIPIAWWYGPAWREQFPDRNADGTYPTKRAKGPGMFKDVCALVKENVYDLRHPRQRLNSYRNEHGLKLVLLNFQQSVPAELMVNLILLPRYSLCSRLSGMCFPVIPQFSF